ncbi:MAG: hypothetical protein AAFO91_04420, partial [Bacteroidota bacterium]
GGQQQLLQEKINNQVAMDNYRYQQKVDDQRLAEANAAIARNNKKRAALAKIRRDSIKNAHAGRIVGMNLDKAATINKIRKGSNQQAAKAASSAAARGLLAGGDAHVARLKSMTAEEVADSRSRIEAKAYNDARVASRQAALQIAASYIEGQGDAMKQKIEGRAPTLFDSTRQVQYLMGRQASNMQKEFNMNMLNAQEARSAAITNAQASYNAAKAAANSQMLGTVGGALVGYAVANNKFGTETMSYGTTDPVDSATGGFNYDMMNNPSSYTNPSYMPTFDALA